MSENIEQKCLTKGVKLTDQRKIIAKIMSESNDHPNVDELYNRVSKIDSKISIATVYRTVKLFEESGILAKHEFKGGKARYEELNEECSLVKLSGLFSGLTMLTCTCCVVDHRVAFG